MFINYEDQHMGDNYNLYTCILLQCTRSTGIHVVVTGISQCSHKRGWL